MKNILLSSVALIGMTAGAFAADLPSRRVAPAPYVAVPVFTWTGFYVGANAGYGFSTGSDKNFGFNNNIYANGTPFGTGVTPVVSAGALFGGGTNNRNNDGFVGGGQVGYNYQIGSVVLGVEGDIQYTDFNRRRGVASYGTAVVGAPNIGPVLAGAPGNVSFLNAGNQSDFYGTVRGRLGYAIDRTLIYATGGVAFRDTNNDQQYNPYFGYAYNRNKSNDTGYVVGGGVEYAFTPNITGRIEGFYVNFSDNGRNNVVGLTNTGRPIISTGGKQDDDFAVVRAGINYKFTTF